MKRIFAIILAFIFIFALAGCQKEEKAKKEIFDFVEKNYDLLVEACVAKDADALSAFDRVTQVNITDGYIILYCTGEGIAPSSQDYGFYYSEENQPVAVGCNLDILCHADNLLPEGNGYQYIEDRNVFYTEHIKGNIYFYSTAY